MHEFRLGNVLKSNVLAVQTQDKFVAFDEFGEELKLGLKRS